MVPDALLTFLDLPLDLGPLLAVDRFSNFLFLRWPCAPHKDYPLTVDLRSANRYEDYSCEQQRCLLTFLQRAVIIKVGGGAWASTSWKWRKCFNFCRYTSWRGPRDGVLRRSRYLGDSRWYFSSTPVPSPLHMTQSGHGALSRICFVLTDHGCESDESAICDTVLGTRRPRNGFFLELTVLFGRGGALAEVFFRGHIVRQWFLPEVDGKPPFSSTVTFDRHSVDVTMNMKKVLTYKSTWASSIGHCWEDACVPADPYLAAALVGADQVTLVLLPTELRTGRVVAASC